MNANGVAIFQNGCAVKQTFSLTTRQPSQKVSFSTSNWLMPSNWACFCIRADFDYNKNDNDARRTQHGVVSQDES